MRRLGPSRRVALCIERLDPLYRDLTTGLNFGSPLQLLVATILSAQCTDERVNEVTPRLFERYLDVTDFANASPVEMEAIIHSCGFFRNKGKNIRAAASAIQDRFHGEVPATMSELITLPGVARKTANVVLSHAFARNEGIAVDTHVIRLSRRLGLTVESDPVKIERELMRFTKRVHWGRLSDLLIWHGRKVCSARNPACHVCVLADFCPSAGTGQGPLSGRR